MSLKICNLCRSPLPKPANISSPPFPNAPFLIFSRNSRNPSSSFRCLSNPSFPTFSLDDVANVLHNKVLVAAGISAAIGQLAKPFTSILLYGKKFDFKASVQSGGFPSTHSSAAVATATSLALERGFSDTIFGLAVVYACLIMYDAQGVRREVGNHAKQMNKYFLDNALNSTSIIKEPLDSCSTSSYPNSEKIEPLILEEQCPSKRQATSPQVLLKSDTRKTSSSTFVRSYSEGGFSPLKESIGHTELEVIAGGLLGFLVSIAICPYV